MYVDLVLCKHDNNDKTYLFKADYKSVKAGDIVMCDTKYGNARATVVDVISLDDKTGLYGFILKAAEVKPPLRNIIGIYKYEPLRKSSSYSAEFELPF